MLVRNFSTKFAKDLTQYSFFSKSLKEVRLSHIHNQKKFSFSEASKQQQSNNQQKNTSIVEYIPIRPLKKHLTQLYVEADLLNKGQIIKKVAFWPFLTPFYAMLINNFLTSWSFTNTSITAGLFVLGLLIRQQPKRKRQYQILKFESNKEMTKLYMTVHYSFITEYIETNYPESYKFAEEWSTLTEEDYKNPEYIPTEADKRTYTEEELEKKKEEFDNKLFKKLLKENRLKQTIARFELDSSKTLFMLSDEPFSKIEDIELIHPPILTPEQMLNIPFKYLIVKTEFVRKYRGKSYPIHYYMDLEHNGDLKYQDYLIALGAQYKISLDSEIK